MEENLKKINLIGCDTIVNSPSSSLFSLWCLYYKWNAANDYFTILVVIFDMISHLWVFMSFHMLWSIAYSISCKIMWINCRRTPQGLGLHPFGFAAVSKNRFGLGSNFFGFGVANNEFKLLQYCLVFGLASMGFSFIGYI